MESHGRSGKLGYIANLDSHLIQHLVLKRQPQGNIIIKEIIITNITSSLLQHILYSSQGLPYPTAKPLRLPFPRVLSGL